MRNFPRGEYFDTAILGAAARFWSVFFLALAVMAIAVL